ncbi:hypothetical protein M2171_007495 [Bradyrhizobium japonicum USDA 38]|uniref:hypothetical protein n=1 Tax=Bradyrhizobium japonicum TaxID=375 RepID=UPI0012BB600F|nr:hypothetical protein [Bradyrhizobium japonicum]MCS3898362.1 hypothetical protein [Bradyrhizobium japonicum USDA 38]MCS3941415.1 hypothetical protein [Bradyrhizobium japonicum]MCW2216528.1 hypothetical protein [Bradyrhizobium japonicum]MCW2341145.1 hypothetical protein [Bradyrhizobium japonicum]
MISSKAKRVTKRRSQRTIARNRAAALKFAVAIPIAAPAVLHNWIVEIQNLGDAATPI